MVLEKLSDILLHENSEPVEFVIKTNYLLTEDNEYIPSGGASAPRFLLVMSKVFKIFLNNKPVAY
jgi:hypothetical protein